MLGIYDQEKVDQQSIIDLQSQLLEAQKNQINNMYTPPATSYFPTPISYVGTTSSLFD
jgi:hypothetical protein